MVRHFVLKHDDFDLRNAGLTPQDRCEQIIHGQLRPVLQELDLWKT